ncbi:unnamed protein product [Cyclocybe aegerita]|uniref:Potassium channel domain-containing protein n=1 Tax=Cyclocybe aegerita TaxID=1973307 RepID=A0A8S0W0H2_CYCAE|nr:unnamed protein product [Cyclocybe aegerita]
MPDDRLNVSQSGEETAAHQYRFLPIFSGIMIPFSIMLSIPSLTGHWYIRTGDNDVTIEVRPNPLMLDMAMGMSMGCDIINIPAVTIFGIQHRFDDGFTYGQSFWMTVCSTLASTATNITLIVDYARTTDFAQSGSGLTRKQRSLAIIIIILLCYISLGALIQTIMLKIAFIDALYFTVASIETVGFGDIRPTSTGTRIFTCCYIAGGILNLALAVAMASEALLEAAAVGFQSRLKLSVHASASAVFAPGSVLL